MRNEVKLANPNHDSSKIEEFKNVWVFCEQREGKLMPTSKLISEGRELADELGVNLCGLLGGEGSVVDLARAWAATALMRCSSATTPAGRLHHRCLCQGHLRRDRGAEARGVPDRRHQHRP